MYTVTGTILFHLSLQAKSTLKKDFQSQVEFWHQSHDTVFFKKTAQQ